MKFALASLLLVSVSTPALAVGQLPANVAPVAYDITVKPDAKAMTFSGTETVTIDVRQATSTIVLNAVELKLGKVTFDGKDMPFAIDDTTQQLTVTLPAPAKVGTHTMSFAWDGKINTTSAGFFAIDYKNPDGSAARMLATQFEAPDARRFAPMWDEPAFKAKFTLSAVAPGNQTAFSNMPAARVTNLTDGTKKYTFQQSPVMSSYLLFLGMGDVERKTVMAGKTEIGVITRRGVVDQGDYALAEAKRLLVYYNDYFGQPYPLPKLDMIAGPGSSQFFGAMENWGAIFYFEPELLFDPKHATQSGRDRIFTVVAHEMAHQWFGDLVTMSWWDDLWLNEGFASWMENKTSRDLNPTWDARASAVAFDREGALGLDATSATHPIIRHVETVDQLGEAFDSITYQKGQAVIGMMESTLGDDVFRKGIRSYMAKYKYGNTVTDQLWTELGAAAGKPVVDIAHDFTLQGGVPLVKLTGATCNGGTTQVSMTQGRFGYDEVSKKPQTWRVPLTLGPIGGPVTSTIVQGAVPATVAVRGCGTLVLNRDKGSYVRVQYDDASHAAIVRDFSKMALTDQVGTLGDDYALALSGDQSLDRYLAVQAAVPLDASPLDWSVVAGNLRSLTNFFQGTPLEAPLRARTIALLSPVMKRVGFDAKAGESPLITNLRETLVGRLGYSGDPDVAAKARAYVAALATDPNAIPPAIRAPILGVYAVNATPAEWEALLAITKAEKNPVTRNTYVQLLGTARDDALAQRALDLLKTGEFTNPQKAGLIRAVAGRHPEMAFDFAVANRDMVNGLLETSTRSSFIVSLGTTSNDPAMPGKITAYAEKNLPEASRGGVTRVLSAIAVRKQGADRVRADVAKWVSAGN
ncbi:M1 family metallopeptidase [Sphingomonas sp. QA11]|uniref:M1 family metallopeptidase n=1 Tax=Sphingomonas sp. QA11 TaxID=2950605 RepID=UPI00234B84D1|nr:M1 family metallopeptidase [Sphingomonas sp. QA11]WCM28841.1 M1 family metallopeptidase [Sphingomonas sp. QA11]